MSDMKDMVKVSFWVNRLDHEKMKFLGRHDDTDGPAHQYRQATKKYLANRKKTVYGQNPLEPEE